MSASRAVSPLSVSGAEGGVIHIRWGVRDLLSSPLRVSRPRNTDPMHVWRPPSEIRVKARGLPWRGSRLLVAEVYTDDGRLKGVRPLGGSVGFGEPAEAALVREFREELGLTVRVLGAPFVMENLYTHEGSPGHEVLFLFPVALPPSALDKQERVVFHEDCGTPCIARWCDLEELDRAGGPDLYPVGLKARLLAEGRP